MQTSELDEKDSASVCRGSSHDSRQGEETLSNFEVLVVKCRCGLWSHLPRWRRRWREGTAVFILFAHMEHPVSSIQGNNRLLSHHWRFLSSCVGIFGDVKVKTVLKMGHLRHRHFLAFWYRRKIFCSLVCLFFNPHAFSWLILETLLEKSIKKNS